MTRLFIFRLSLKIVDFRSVKYVEIFFITKLLELRRCNKLKSLVFNDPDSKKEQGYLFLLMISFFLTVKSEIVLLLMEG